MTCKLKPENIDGADTPSNIEGREGAAVNPPLFIDPLEEVDYQDFDPSLAEDKADLNAPVSSTSESDPGISGPSIIPSKEDGGVSHYLESTPEDQVIIGASTAPSTVDQVGINPPSSGVSVPNASIGSPGTVSSRKASTVPVVEICNEFYDPPSKLIKVTREQLYRLISDGQVEVDGEIVTSYAGDVIDTSGITDMTGIFNGNRDVLFDISDWDVSNVTNMTQMFYGLNQYSVFPFGLDLSKWDVSSVTIMNNMFQADRVNLPENFDISTWDVSNVKSMRAMFGRLEFPPGFDISKWDVSNVTDMRNMFSSSSIGVTFNESFDISEWDVSNVEFMQSMFSRCSLNDTFDISEWDVSSVTTMSQMFYWLGSSVMHLDLSRWDVSNVTDMNRMFMRNTISSNVDLSEWDTSSVTSMEETFNSCDFETNAGIQDWDTSSVRNMTRMFNGQSGFTASLKNWDVSNVTGYTQFGLPEEQQPDWES